MTILTREAVQGGGAFVLASGNTSILTGRRLASLGLRAPGVP